MKSIFKKILFCFFREINFKKKFSIRGGSSKDMLSTNFGRLTVNNDRSEEEISEDDSDEITSEESEWEQEVTPSGNVNYIGKYIIIKSLFRNSGCVVKLIV